MFNFLHTFHPDRIALTIGPISLYWYGLIIVLAMVVGLITAITIAKKYQIKSEEVIDLSFWLILAGIIGARIYEVLLNWQYYHLHPLEIPAIWQGGLAIHGGIIAGIITVIVWARHKDLWLWLAIISPAVAIGQAIGRFGNYFNQELFGLPTDLPWGIPIDLINRPNQYISQDFFHPTFLYESLGCLLTFIILIIVQRTPAKNTNQKRLIVLLYLCLYSLLRFVLEFWRIDAAPTWGMWRWPQIMSGLIIIVSLSTYFILHRYDQKTRSQRKTS
jgi:phosphatidylglycerol---prolipoprotein diacylglyceryl transferase